MTPETVSTGPPKEPRSSWCREFNIGSTHRSSWRPFRECQEGTIPLSWSSVSPLATTRSVMVGWASPTRPRTPRWSPLSRSNWLHCEDALCRTRALSSPRTDRVRPGLRSLARRYAVSDSLRRPRRRSSSPSSSKVGLNTRGGPKA